MDLAVARRIVICGGPRTGKTTLARTVHGRRPLIHTDAYIADGWGDAPLRVISAVSGLEAYVVEGVQAARTLRKGLPADVVVWLEGPFVPLTPGQERMAAGIATTFASVELSLIREGVRILRPTRAELTGGSPLLP